MASPFRFFPWPPPARAASGRPAGPGLLPPEECALPQSTHPELTLTPEGQVPKEQPLPEPTDSTAVWAHPPIQAHFGVSHVRLVHAWISCKRGGTCTFCRWNCIFASFLSPGWELGRRRRRRGAQAYTRRRVWRAPWAVCPQPGYQPLCPLHLGQSGPGVPGASLRLSLPGTFPLAPQWKESDP